MLFSLLISVAEFGKKRLVVEVFFIRKDNTLNRQIQDPRIDEIAIVFDDFKGPAGNDCLRPSAQLLGVFLNDGL